MELLDGIIIKGVGGLYSVSTKSGLYSCKARGTFRNDNITPLAGDRVTIRIIDEEKLTGSIDAISKRTSELRRPRVANVEQAAIVCAVKSPTINYGLLDRLIILVENEGLDTIICVNKTDLDKDDTVGEIKETYTKIGYGVYPVSTVDNRGIDELNRGLRDKVTVFSGPSGVGKSSIINALLSAELMETGDMSKKIDRGKHTTRHTQMLMHENGYIVDSPGFTSLYLDHIEQKKLPYLFKEFRPYLNRCRFSDCTHIKETECGIKEQVGVKISEKRYENYISMYNEITAGMSNR